MTPRRLTPLAAVIKGAVAGLAGTAAMDLVLWERYRRQGGPDDFVRWQSSAGLVGCEGAPAPAQVGRRIVEGYLQRELPDRTARATNIWPAGATVRPEGPKSSI